MARPITSVNAAITVSTRVSGVTSGNFEANRPAIRDVLTACTIPHANGTAPAYKVSLSSVRIGDVQVYNVEAVVSPAPMPFMLLGNSFLDRFQMRRENDRLTLEKK